MAAKDQALWIATGGPVERLGDRGPPIDDQGIVLGAVDGQPADVEGLDARFDRRPRTVALSPGLLPVVHPVDPAEGECLVTDVELLQPGQAGPNDHVAFGA